VNNDLTSTCTACDSYGDALIQPGGDYDKVLGNYIHGQNPTGSISNLNHSIYSIAGPDHIEIAYNYIHNNRVGYTILLNTDNAHDNSQAWEDFSIHGNLIDSANYADCRGINIGDCADATSGVIYDNIITHLGQQVCGIGVCNGTVKIYNNTLYDMDPSMTDESSAGIMVYFLAGRDDDVGSVDIQNNIITFPSTAGWHILACSGAGYNTGALKITGITNNDLYKGTSAEIPAMATGTITSDPLFTAAASLDFSLQSGSPCRDKGTDLSGTFTNDYVGYTRSAWDIGAYEYESSVPLIPALSGVRYFGPGPLRNQ
jgi:hypothetical protein